MAQAPSTVVQLAILVMAVLPGATYQFMRQRWRGPVPTEHDLGERILRAIVVSILLDTGYLVIAGPALAGFAAALRSHGWQAVLDQPRLIGLAGFAMFVAVPAAAAGAVSWWQRRNRRAARYRAVPTAWDQMFRDRGSCFVRVKLKSGGWAGGWYGSASFATSYPEVPELYLQTAWLMNPDGSFNRAIKDSAGLRVTGADVEVLELLAPPSSPIPQQTSTMESHDEVTGTPVDSP